jgi:hypothetical protein
MKKLLQLNLLALTLLATPLARAWTYNDQDVLLVFRESGFNNVEFDIGNISQFLNKPNGYTAPVTDWDLNLVTNTFGSDLTGVSVIVAGTTSSSGSSRASWLSSANPTAVPHDLTPSGWQSDLWSIINAIGTKPVLLLLPTAGASAYSIDPSGTLRVASYDYIVSPNGNSIPQFGGHATFTVEKTIPGSFGFWQIEPTSTNPKPEATFIGSFTIDAGGTLTFTAGPPPSNILGITRSGGVSTVTFSTSAGGNYWLLYTNTLSGPVSSWLVVDGPVGGDSNNKSLTHTTADSKGFYTVQRTP